MSQHEDDEPNSWQENRKLVERLLSDLAERQREQDKTQRETDRANEKRFQAIELQHAKTASIYGLLAGAVGTIIAELIKHAFK